MLEDWQAKWKKRKVSKNLILIDKKIHKAKRILFKKKNEENKKMEEKGREDRIRREKTRQEERKEKKRKDERR